MVQAVSNHQVCCPKLEVISGNLVKSILGDHDFWRFALYHKVDAAIWVKDDEIITFYHAIDCYFFLDIDKAKWVSQLLVQVMQYVLSHPFSGVARTNFFAYHIKKKGLIFTIFDAQCALRKI